VTGLRIFLRWSEQMKRDDYDAPVTDASGKGGLALQRPGFRLMDGATSDAKK
jgi:hypothetical protein